MRSAYEAGINLFDAAELYGTYSFLSEAFGDFKEARPLLIGRSYAWSKEGMEKSLNLALRESRAPRMDIFMLHQQESALTLAGHRGALDYLVSARFSGLVGAVAISTHHIAVVRAASEMPEVEVIFATFNCRGLGIMDGTAEEMAEALQAAHSKGKGILAMKALGGGHLIPEAAESLRFCLDQPFVDSVVVGMKSPDELRMNLLVEAGEAIPSDLKRSLSERKRRLLIEDCQGCGRCLAVCRSGALRLCGERCEVEAEKCVLCGYCAFECPEFCIKVI